jgi:curved DNA-binding protein CbpA
VNTYYDMLKVAPSASGAEIEAAFEEQYNQWRQLTTHHKPQVVEEANRAMRLLEEARTTLTDPARRAAYDLTLNIGGLADPEVLLKEMKAGPAAPSASSPTSASAGSLVDAWVCPECGTPSPKGTPFCKHCAYRIGIQCPKCGGLTEAAAPHCSQCGADLQAELQRKRAEEEQQRRQTEAQKLARLQAEVAALEPSLEQLSHSRGELSPSDVGGGCVITALLAVPLLLVALTSPSISEENRLVYWLLASTVILAIVVWIRRSDRAGNIDKEIQTGREQLLVLQQELEQLQKTPAKEV